MLTILIATAAGVLGGALAGVLVYRALADRRRTTRGSVSFDTSPIDPAVDQRIRTAAAQWATAHNAPGAAPLITQKLRLVHRLHQRRMNPEGTVVALLVIVLMAAVLVLAWIAYAYVQTFKSDPTHYRSQLGLHTARRRLEVGQLKSECKRDAAQARRELREELRGDNCLNRKRPRGGGRE